MKHKLLLIAVCFSVLILSVKSYAQDGTLIDPTNSQVRNNAAALEIYSSNQGFLAPRVTLTALNTFNPPITTGGAVNSLLVYNSAGSLPFGYYYWDGSSWQRLVSGNGSFPTGSGTPDYLARWITSSTLGTGVTYDNGTNVGISTTGPAGKLDVRVAGAGTWDRFVVKTSSLWGDGLVSPAENGGTEYVTIGAGGAAGIMISNPHVVWSAGNGAAAIRYGRGGGTSAGEWWESGVNAGSGFHIRKNASGATGIEILNNGNVGIGLVTPGSKLEVMTGAVTLSAAYLDINRDAYAQNGISWYSQSYPSWSSYMAQATQTSVGPHGDLTAPSGTFVTSWALRNYIEDAGGYGWTYESAANTTTPTIKFEIRASDGLFHSYGNGIVDGNIGIGSNSPTERLDIAGNGRATGVMYWGNAGTRTETRDDAGLMGGRSGYYETSVPAPAADWYTGASSWQHLLEVRHSNTGNNFAMQIAGSFFDQDFWVRKTANSATTAWSKMLTTSNISTIAILNQNASAQTANFWISGNAQIGSNFTNLGGRVLTSNQSGWVADGVTPQMVISSTTTSTDRAALIGLDLHNDATTVNTYSPFITFSRRGNSTSYNSAFAAIGAQATGQGTDANWVAGDLMFSTEDGEANGLQERMRIDYYGRVGVNVVSPQGQIHSQGKNRGATTSQNVSGGGTFMGGGDGCPWCGTHWTSYSTVPGSGVGNTDSNRGGIAGGLFYGGVGEWVGGGGAGLYAHGGDGSLHGFGGVGIYAKGGAHGANVVGGRQAAGYFDGNLLTSGGLVVGSAYSLNALRNPSYGTVNLPDGYAAFSGNVGIGTSNPQGALDVNGNFANQNVEWYQAGNGSGNYTIAANSGAVVINNTPVTLVKQDGTGTNGSTVLLVANVTASANDITWANGVGGYQTVQSLGHGVAGYRINLQRSTDNATWTNLISGSAVVGMQVGDWYMQYNGITSMVGISGDAFKFSNNVSLNWIDDVGAGTYYYRLEFVPSGYNKSGGSYLISDRSLSVVQIKR